MALVVNLCENLCEALPDFKSFFINVVFRNQNVVTLKELEQNPSICKKVVGLYMHSSLNRNQEFLELFEKLVNLKIICFLGIGFETIDTEWAKSRGIRIGHSIQDGVTAANFGMALLLAMSRKIVQCAEYFPKTLKKKLYPPELMAHDVTGNSIGIIGMGTIGYKLAIRAHAFEMKVLYHQRRQRSKEEEAKVDAQFYSSLMDMLPLCDYVVITCALTPQTYHLIGHKELVVMKKTATLINIARGDIIDQGALVEALESGRIAGAALDVTTPEPLPTNHKLYNFPNVIITPHCATNTAETMKEIRETAFKNMELGLRGEPMLSEVKLD
ncbi:glyoxylate reductase/hydroxypyruvate reductase isoform X1 [Octopus bimaculoides]|uniref:D-isomer specific 2-hydroxyacid dehydrogenase NAD-binding domain-containing protein n=1 Tax=Octopus bimaculoides TaxID=37653 RepID=A0A0L8FP54_OCTBM|nr:glyoxylate reductase/hydroxypyruvate reductase isoform X1 [Octopus bimaculoides]|eukprot:XP_014788120.1 PREDICTED: glyoxylate reductase/hydroxypyruvate reductase-like [Octopus bimaculoides]